MHPQLTSRDPPTSSFVLPVHVCMHYLWGRSHSQLGSAFVIVLPLAATAYLLCSGTWASSWCMSMLFLFIALICMLEWHLQAKCDFSAEARTAREPCILSCLNHCYKKAYKTSFKELIVAARMWSSATVTEAIDSHFLPFIAFSSRSHSRLPSLFSKFHSQCVCYPKQQASVMTEAAWKHCCTRKALRFHSTVLLKEK